MNRTNSTRDELLYMLKKQKQLTVAEMARQLNITEMAVRRHLNTLERDHLVETSLIRQSMGRPLHKYRLTTGGEEDNFPRSYASLTLGFLQDMDDIGGQPLIEQLFESREKRLEKQYTERIENRSSFAERVSELADIQNENGYMADFEEVDDGSFVMTEMNCPISQVANQYNKACSCEISLFRNVLGDADINRTDCMAKGGNHCRYVIKEAREHAEENHALSRVSQYS